MYVVSIDKPSEKEPVVHSTNCSIYLQRKKDIKVEWYGPYHRYLDAWKMCFNMHNYKTNSLKTTNVHTVKAYE